MTDHGLSEKDREGELGWRLLKVLAGAFVLLTVGLILDGVGATGGALAAVIGILVIVAVIWMTPVIDWVSKRLR
ncbi:MAG: hypothetical protein ACEQSX_01255 [Baekduiaceae bacterium]